MYDYLGNKRALDVSAMRSTMCYLQVKTRIGVQNFGKKASSHLSV